MNWTRIIAGRATALLFAAVALTAAAQTAAAQSEPKTSAAASSERDWWKNAVLYEIYPRSFQDSKATASAT